MDESVEQWMLFLLASIIVATVVGVTLSKLNVLTAMGLATSAAIVGGVLSYLLCFMLNPSSAYYCALATALTSPLVSSALLAFLAYSSTTGNAIVALSVRPLK